MIMKITYMVGDRMKTFKISNKKIVKDCGIPYGHDKEQPPKVIKPLSYWCTKVVPRASMIGSTVRLSDMFRNQLALHDMMSDNQILGGRGLNKRQCELLYVLQKRIDMKEDGSLVKPRDFQYSLHKTLWRVSLILRIITNLICTFSLLD